MRISFVSGAYPPMRCGIGDFVGRLADEMVHLGHQALVLTAAEGDPRHGQAEVWPMIPHWRPNQILSIMRLLARSHPDIVNLHYPSQEFGRFSAVDPLPWLWRLGRQVPLVLTIHEYTSFTRAGRLRIAALAAASRRVIVPESGNLAALAADRPFLAARLNHIPLGPTLEPVDLDPAALQEARQATGMIAGRFNLVYTGFISPGKGVEYLLAAFASLAPRFSSLHLWLATDNRPAHPNYRSYHERIAAQVEALAERERLHWTGYLPASRLSTMLRLADAIVLPYDDGVSMRRTTLLNALAHGRPVVSTGSAPPAPGVMVVPPRDPGQLAAALARLIDHPDEAWQLAQAAAAGAALLQWGAVAVETGRLMADLAAEGEGLVP